MAWEYPDDSLKCLCEECHLREKEYHDKLMISLRDDYVNKDIVRGYVDGLRLLDNKSLEIELDSAEQAMGLEKCWAVDEDFIWANTIKRGKDLFVSYQTYLLASEAYKRGDVIYDPYRRDKLKRGGWEAVGAAIKKA